MIWAITFWLGIALVVGGLVFAATNAVGFARAMTTPDPFGSMGKRASRHFAAVGLVAIGAVTALVGAALWLLERFG